MGGQTCCKEDLDIMFQQIDMNGDQVISKKEYLVLIDKLLRTLQADSLPSYALAVKFANNP